MLAGGLEKPTLLVMQFKLTQQWYNYPNLLAQQKIPNNNELTYPLIYPLSGQTQQYREKRVHTI